MKREAVESSNITSIGYDPDEQKLEVEFHGGSIYQYFEVPETLYRYFIEAESKGKFFAQNVKGYFPFKKTKGGE